MCPLSPTTSRPHVRPVGHRFFRALHVDVLYECHWKVHDAYSMWALTRTIDSTPWIQYSRPSSDIGQNKLLRLCSNELHHRSRIDLLHVTNTTNTILPTEWWTSPKMNIGWQQAFTKAHPNVSKERTKNAQFIVISLRNHMPLGVSNWRFPAGKLFAHPLNLDTLGHRRRHANNSWHMCFVHLCPITDPTSEGDDWI